MTAAEAMKEVRELGNKLALAAGENERGIEKMARKPMDIKIRIERQEKKILRLTEELEEAKKEYEKLLEVQEEEDMKKLVEAYKKSKKKSGRSD